MRDAVLANLDVQPLLSQILGNHGMGSDDTDPASSLNPPLDVLGTEALGGSHKEGEKKEEGFSIP